ncbi:hypothetical protein C882_2713 [Caenispirillum salinarum AK4]|uniref:Cytidylate kinase n=1 Tax=Caenispirillum salinarum AK4 TaxID=1238182 RepID=K9H6H4_9PROT|nr:cytidylate kinase-like family protein [Caenispirillum salinarum]EKV32634.1 hypothetical protein C882_2713 [Caenispirillum salinarum AK4]
MPDVQAIIQAMLAATSAPGHEDKPRERLPAIAISRDYGSGGDEIAQLLSQRLHLKVYDREMIDKVAQRIGTDPQTVRQLDEGIGRVREMWLTRLFSGQDLSPDTYKRHLVDVILSLGRAGGVLLGRGAHVVLSTSTALRVRITGSPEMCTRRVAAAEGLSYDDALDKVREINHNRGKFVWDLFHVRTSDAHNFDIVVNTDRLVDFNQAAAMLENAYHAIGGMTTEADAAAG